MPTATLELESVTPNVFTTTKLRGCNPSFVVTSDGVVAIDTPQLPTRAVAMRQEAESRGPIRYLINTENHVDHIFGNLWVRGAGEVVNHRALYEIFMDPKAALDPFAYALEAIPTDDPDGAPLIPDRDAYYAELPRGTVVFTGDLTLKVGEHTIDCLWTPGHTPGQLDVHGAGLLEGPVAPALVARVRLFPRRERPRWSSSGATRSRSGRRRCRRAVGWHPAHACSPP